MDGKKDSDYKFRFKDSGKDWEEEKQKLWRSLKEKLAKEITPEELVRMKKSCESYLQGKDLNLIGTALQLFRELEMCHVVGLNKTSVLSTILEDIERTDLALEVLLYEENVRTTVQ
ncbi:uncharacterized protein [Ptychodera flava]|uniref:uncharacterized protein n=1 Tax=Ptychodera flava TaxID=63121 RepID=UPI00396A5537